MISNDLRCLAKLERCGGGGLVCPAPLDSRARLPAETHCGDAERVAGDMSNLTINIDGRAVCLIFDDTSQRAIGTGFVFLRPDWVVTAKHVVLEQGLPRSQLSLVFFRREEAIEAQVAVIHPSLDLAVLRLLGQARARRRCFPVMSGTRGGGVSSPWGIPHQKATHLPVNTVC